MRRLTMMVVLLLGATASEAQSVLERTPNVQGVWSLDAAEAVFLFAHRFELLDGADELRNIPTLTVATGLPFGLVAGLDYTSNSEISRAAAGANEVQYWLRRPLGLTPGLSAAVLAGYNTRAGSYDAAGDLRLELGPVALLGEVRAMSDAFGAGSAEAAGTVGATVRLTPFLAVGADIGRLLSTDSLGTVWSAGVAAAIPGTPHTLSIQAANNGATTLHGVSRRPEGALRATRYGFVFTVPLGTGSQWGRIFRPAPVTAAGEADAVTERSVVRVEMRSIEFVPREVRVPVGAEVEWVNLEPTVHTVTADDGSWGSDPMLEGARFRRRFDEPGRYEYHCLPHPTMRGVVVVEG